MIRRMTEGGSNRIKASDWNKIAEAVERAQNPLAGGASKPMKGNCWLYNNSSDYNSSTGHFENRVTPAFTLVPLFPKAFIRPNLDDLNTLHEPVLQFQRNGNVSPSHEYYDKEIKAKYPNSTNSKYAVTLSETKSGEICRGIVGGGIVPVLTTVHSASHRFVRAYYDDTDPSRFLKTETHPFEGFRIITQLTNYNDDRDVGENKICLVSLDHDHVIFENPYKGPFAISVIYKKVVDVPADPEADPPVEEQSHMGAFVKVNSGYCIVSGRRFSASEASERRFYVSEKIFEREISADGSTDMFEIVLKYDSALGNVVILESEYIDTFNMGTNPAIYIGSVSKITGITQSLHGYAYLFSKTVENPYKGPFAISLVYKRVVDVPADPEADPPVEEQSHMGAFVKVNSGYCIVSGSRFSVNQKTFERELKSNSHKFEIVLKYDSALGDVVILEDRSIDTFNTGPDPAIYIGSASTSGITQSLHGHAYLFRLETLFCPTLNKKIVYIDKHT